MSIPRKFIENLIFMRFRNTTRYTQDSPVYPDVWMKYFEHAETLETTRIDLILIPHRDSSASELFTLLNNRRQLFSNNSNAWELASSGESVVACLTFFEMIAFALPLTAWWHKYLWKDDQQTAEQLWLLELAGAILYQSMHHSLPVEESEASLREKFMPNFWRALGLHIQILKIPLRFGR